MSWVAAAIGGSAIVGGVLGSSASKSAASSQAAASEKATAAQISASDRALEAQLEMAHIAAGATTEAASKAAAATMYAADQQGISAQAAIDAQIAALAEARKLNLPYVKAGKYALKKWKQMLSEGPGEFEADPGYQFRLEEGNKNILANASATGGLASGRTMKALQEYGQDYASNEFSKFYNKYLTTMGGYQDMTSIGQNAAALTGNQAISTGQGIANTYNNLGNSQMQAGMNLSNIYQNEGIGLAGIYSDLGNNTASTYVNQGALTGQNYMNQGDISARSSIGQANAWTGAIQNAATGLGMYYGNQQQPSWGNMGGYNWNRTSNLNTMPTSGMQFIT